MIGGPATSRFPLRSIRVRLSAAFTLLLALLLLVADCGIISYIHYTDAQRVNKTLDDALETVRVALENESDEADWSAAQSVQRIYTVAGEALHEITPTLAQDGVSVLVVDDQGVGINGGKSVVASVFSLGTGNSTDEAGGKWAIRSLVVRPEEKKPYSYKVTAVLSLLPFESARTRLAILLLGLTVFAILIVAVGAFVLVGRTLRPIDLLSQQALEQAERAALPVASLQLVSPSPDAEIDSLVTTLNHLLSTLNQNSEAKSRFYTAASHELRTPLQVLSGRIELTLSRPRDGEEYHAALVELQEHTNHLVALVQSLLLLNRLERTAPATGGEECEITSVIQEHLESLEPQIRKRHLNVVSEESRERIGPVKAITAAHLEILVRNLLDNAVRYTAEQGAIHIHVNSQAAGGVRIDIVNDIAPSNYPVRVGNLFEPFYRPDPSRNAETGGNGLGLTICRTLAQLNGWDLSLAQNESEFRVVVVFPEVTAELVA